MAAYDIARVSLADPQAYEACKALARVRSAQYGGRRLVARAGAAEMRMILVDPKFIEFRAYQDIPHLLLPVVDDARRASRTGRRWPQRDRAGPGAGRSVAALGAPH